MSWGDAGGWGGWTQCPDFSKIQSNNILFSCCIDWRETFQIRSRHIFYQKYFNFLGRLRVNCARGDDNNDNHNDHQTNKIWSCGGNNIESEGGQSMFFSLFLPCLKAPSVWQNRAIQGRNNHRKIWDCVVKFSNIPAHLKQKTNQNLESFNFKSPSFNNTSIKLKLTH